MTTKPISEGSPRNKKITVRVTAEEFAEIRRRADQAGREEVISRGISRGAD